MTRNLSLAFMVFASTFTLSTLLGPYPLSWLLKIVPILLLVFVAYSNSKQRFHRLFLIGLVFSVVGDFLLDYDGVNGFVYGLGAFLIAQLFYISSFLPIKRQHMRYVFIYIMGGVVMFGFIYQSLGELFIPVLVYMSILLLAGIGTLTSEKTNRWLVLGGLSFIISDSLIALDRFYSDIPASGFMIMASYYCAQYCLVKGVFTKNTL